MSTICLICTKIEILRTLRLIKARTVIQGSTLNTARVATAFTHAAWPKDCLNTQQARSINSCKRLCPSTLPLLTLVWTMCTRRRSKCWYPHIRTNSTHPSIRRLTTSTRSISYASTTLSAPMAPGALMWRHNTFRQWLREPPPRIIMVNSSTSTPSRSATPWPNIPTTNTDSNWANITTCSKRRPKKRSNQCRTQIQGEELARISQVSMTRHCLRRSRLKTIKLRPSHQSRRSTLCLL